MSEQERYILPFFWQHGESEEILREYMGKIEESGISAVCVESRPHPDFVGDQWWKDLSIIIDEAKKRDMKVWILDDAHFPTGYANGAVKNAQDRLKKWHLNCSIMDVRGPLVHHRFAIAKMLGIRISFSEAPKFVREEVVAVMADKRMDPDRPDTAGELIDLTGCLKDGYLEWNVPDGMWRIYTVTKLLDACNDKNDYVNMLEKDSVQLLLDAVYEPHYAHFGDEFGKTIGGFFSDEPGFYNSTGSGWDFRLKPGKNGMPVPWSDTMEERFSKRLGGGWKQLLPCLWYPCGSRTDQVRYAYMDLATKLYQENFSGNLGIWCREHGVEYIGHVLEDQNVHMRLGSGAGHYFRSVGGQDMAGVDVIMSQIIPGNDYGHYYMVNPDELTDGCFYHYGLAKLGASLGHVTPHMKGRSLVELFGAYGWSTGVTMMKWLTDHFLVRGINHFVPHAFSPAEFPDPDCPPHFYARGNNPQFAACGKVFRYMDRMSRLLSDGVSTVSAAVLYPAEGEWLGEIMNFQILGRELLQHQIDYDLISFDNIDSEAVENGRLTAGLDSFSCLFVPEMEKLPGQLLRKLDLLEEKGFPVIYINRVPLRIAEGTDEYAPVSAKETHKVITLAELAETAEKYCAAEIGIKAELPGLRYYHYRKSGQEIYMFFNEAVGQQADFDVQLPYAERVLEYDAMENRYYEAGCTAEGLLSLKLAPGEAATYVSFDPAVEAGTRPQQFLELTDMDIEWAVSVSDYKTPGEWEALGTEQSPEDIYYKKPHFSGTIRYEGKCLISDKPDASPAESGISISGVSEAVTLYVNGNCCGTCVGAPYRFDARGYLCSGTNDICVEVVTNLYYSQEDMLSQVSPIPPMGICK